MDSELTAANFGDGVPGNSANRRRLKIYKRSLFRRIFFRRWVLYALAFGFVICVAGGVTAYIWAKPLWDRAYSFDLSKLQEVETASVILDRDRKEISRIYVENRTPVDIEEVPYHFIQALVATEDSRFFSHSGVDYLGIGRVAWAAARGKGINQGASTITQQLARQTYSLFDRSVERKVTEIFLARRIEQHLSKSEILELYLNRIYFGSGYWGIKAAAEGYFGKAIEDLTLGESAALTGLIKNPRKYSPILEPENSRKTRNYVLSRMVQEGMISEDTYKEIEPLPVAVAPRKSKGRVNYIYEIVHKEVEDILAELPIAQNDGEEDTTDLEHLVGSGGYRIYTSIDLEIQRTAEEAVRNQLAKVEERSGYIHQTYDEFVRELKEYQRQKEQDLISGDVQAPEPDYLQCSLLMVDNLTGGVVAMVGGRDFSHSSFNRAYQSERPLGTAFTPFVFAAAFEQGDYFPGTLIRDDPIDNRRVNIGGITGILGEWGAESLSNTYEGELTARRALVLGKNAATIRFGEKVGVDYIREMAKEMGISSELSNYPKTYLGVDPVKMEEVCLTYSAFPNGGLKPTKTHFVTRLENADGVTIWQRQTEGTERVQVIDEISAFQVHGGLKAAIREGTAAPSMTEYGLSTSAEFGGKTGTTHNYRDLWFVGYNSRFTCGVWTGFDLPKAIYDKAFSKDVTLPIWTEVMNSSLAKHPASDIPRPRSGIAVDMCSRSGLQATDYCYESVMGPDGKEVSWSTRYPEVVRTRAHTYGLCNIHSKEGIFRSPGIVAPSNTIDPSEKEDYNRADRAAVRVKGVTLLGADPYHSVAPVIRAVPIAEGGEGEGETEVRKAEAVYPAELGDDSAQIRLKPPGPIQFD